MHRGDRWLYGQRHRRPGLCPGQFYGQAGSYGRQSGGVDPDRNISQITFDSLPHNSAIVLTLSYCGVTHKEGYKHLFVVTVVTTTLATIVNIIMAHLGVI